jgi:hypothetical protein
VFTFSVKENLRCYESKGEWAEMWHKFKISTEDNGLWGKAFCNVWIGNHEQVNSVIFLQVN